MKSSHYLLSISQYHYYLGPITLTQDLEVSKLTVNQMNQIEWKNMLRRTDEIVKADFTFGKVIVDSNLYSNSINGIDMDKDAVLINGNQTILGMRMT